MKCPFTYSDGRHCDGYITEIKIIKANLTVNLTVDNEISKTDIDTRYHVHLHCSEKGNHAGYMRQDPEQMKVWWSDLPREVRKQLE